ncbi:MAG: hypothetical protein J3R72DRAFT_475014 [Linnemannia gamsii]|nr:MAG: hypothetical protein J3R72DRAFT_475014 [Linnemannia gamsii]
MADGDNAMDVDEESYFFNIVTSPKKVFQVTADRELKPNLLQVSASRQIALLLPTPMISAAFIVVFPPSTITPPSVSGMMRAAQLVYRTVPIHLSPACIYIFLASSALAREQGFGCGARLEHLRLRYIKTVTLFELGGQNAVGCGESSIDS